MESIGGLLQRIAASDYAQGLLGKAATAGLFDAFYRTFTAFALVSLPLCLLQDAPFGRVVAKGCKVNGTIGWLVMEIVSPLSFLIGLAQNTPDQIHIIPRSFSAVVHAFDVLPTARKVLAAIYLLHYFNRAIVSSFRNPGRARMNISVPLSAIGFNTINGFLIGSFIGSPTASTNHDGLREGTQGWFYGCVVVCLVGMLGNIYSDEVLYALRRNRPPTTKTTNEHPSQRYGIPNGFLYSYPFSGIAFPNYFTEWIEWTAYALASSALLPSSLAYINEKRISPPVLFLGLLIGVMGPRARSGEKWYRETFGKRYPKERRIVIPGLY